MSAKAQCPLSASYLSRTQWGARLESEDVIFTGLRKSGHFDLEAAETATRAAAHHLGAKVLERLLGAPSSFEREVPCNVAGRRAVSRNAAPSN
jgi:hypothetical protein